MASLLRGGKAAKEELGRTQADLRFALADLKTEQEKLKLAQERRARAEAVATRQLKLVGKLENQEKQLRGESSAKDILTSVFANRAYYQQVLFSADQPLDRVVVDTTQTVPMIRKQLDAFVERLDADVRKAGATPEKGKGQALLIAQKFVPDPKGGEGGWVPQSKVLDDLARFIKSNPAPHGLIVEALALRNSAPREPVLAYFRPFGNDVAFSRGTTLGSVVIPAGAPAESDRKELIVWRANAYALILHLLREQVGPKGKGKVMPLMDPSSPEGYSPGKTSVGGLGPIELFEAIDEVERNPRAGAGDGLGEGASVDGGAAADKLEGGTSVAGRE